MLEVALVGTAPLHTPRFVKRLQALEGVCVKYVCDRDAARAARQAEVLGARGVRDVSEIWCDPGITGAIICSETDRHEALVLGAAAAHKNLLAEKPLGLGAAGKEPWTDLPNPWPHAFELYLDALHGKDAPLAPVHEAAVRSSVMEALYLAARSRQWVSPR
jgi:predicted dehydrogenase